MRWPRRGILIRLLIYVPVLALLAWRAQGGCNDDEPAAAQDDALQQKLAPHRKVITLPDGTQQEIVELTAEEAEAILGHPIPRNLDEIDAKGGDAKGAVEGGAAKSGEVKGGGAKSGAAKGGAAKGGDAEAGAAKGGVAEAGGD